MRRTPDPSRSAAALAGLHFDLDSVMVKSSDELIDPRFAAALHAELFSELGAREGAAALMQIGCLHGLRDALRALAGPVGSGREPAGPVIAPPLVMRYRSCPPLQRGSLELQGIWPDRAEAAARLASLGPCEGVGCFLSAGYTSGWLSGTFDIDLLAIETSCSGSGAPECAFTAREPECWRRAGDAPACALIDALPFPTLRALTRAEGGRRQAAPAKRGAFDPEAAVVHIWGPVMVVPFGGSDEALRAVELIGRDPSAREVSVVIVDLTGAVIDQAFGALALEQIVEAVELWGAEAIFAGASPFCERVIAALDSPPLIVHKELEPAVAHAFRIARSQRRLV